MFLLEANNLCSWYRNRSRLSAEYHPQLLNWLRHRMQDRRRSLSRHVRAGTWSSADKRRNPLQPPPHMTLLACWISRRRHITPHRRCGSPGCWRWQTIALPPPWRPKIVCHLTWKCPSARRLHCQHHPTLQPPHLTTKWPSQLNTQHIRHPTTTREHTNPWTLCTQRKTRMMPWARRLTSLPRSWYIPRHNFYSVASHQCNMSI